MTNSTSFLPSLYIHRYTLRYEALEYTEFPAFQGGWLRSLLGKHLQSIRSKKDPDGKTLYQLMMNNSLPENHPCYKKFEQGGIPRGYVLQVPEICELMRPGDIFEWSLVLTGYLNDYFTEMIPAWINMGLDGFSIHKGTFRLISIVENGPKHESILLYHISESQILPPSLQIRIADFLNWQFKGSKLQIHLLTRTQIREKEIHPVAFDFCSIIDQLACRANDLAMIYCNGTELDIEAFIEAPKLRVETTGINLARSPDFLFRSHSQQQPMWIKGYTGTITYKGRFNRYLPLLKFCEFLHLGNKTTYGCGQYIVIHEQATGI